MNKVFIIGGQAYNFSEPSIGNISKMGEYIHEIALNGIDNVEDLINEMSIEQLACVVSLLVEGDDLLSKQFMYGTKEELGRVLEDYFCEIFPSMKTLVKISKSVNGFTAKSRK